MVCHFFTLTSAKTRKQTRNTKATDWGSGESLTHSYGSSKDSLKLDGAGHVLKLDGADHVQLSGWLLQIETSID